MVMFYILTAKFGVHDVGSPAWMTIYNVAGKSKALLNFWLLFQFKFTIFMFVAPSAAMIWNSQWPVILWLLVLEAYFIRLVDKLHLFC